MKEFERTSSCGSYAGRIEHYTGWDIIALMRIVADAHLVSYSKRWLEGKAIGTEIF